MDSQQDELASQFCDITGTDPSEAREYLDANEWNVEAAVTEYFAYREEALQTTSSPGAEDQTESAPAGRTLERSSGPSFSSTPEQSSTSRSSAQKKKFATLGDFTPSEDNSADDGDQDFFAGGEKSGLAVLNPGDLKRKILEKASRRSELPPPESSESNKKSHFTGTARTLGGDDAPSRVVENTTPEVFQPPPRVQRTLHFWSDGFSVDDGDLYSSEDTRNAQILDLIRQGRAPLSIMNVEPGQAVDVQVKQHAEKYVKPKPKYKPFAGRGQRLGSPTPGIRTQASEAPSPATQSTLEPVHPTLNESEPTVTLQVRLGDGTRLTSRFNTTHTIGDVYDFISAASPASRQRQWVLMTTFPSKELSDKTVVLGDLPEFKRGGVVVQKWQ